MASKKETTKEQLEKLIKAADIKIAKWIEYKDKLLEAISSNPPTKPPKPPL